MKAIIINGAAIINVSLGDVAFGHYLAFPVKHGQRSTSCVGAIQH
jgi:hypothetical protein